MTIRNECTGAGCASGPAACVLQSVQKVSGAWGADFGNNISHVVPWDDTIPQLTEGELILTAPTLTTLSASSKIEVEVVVQVYCNNGGSDDLAIIHVHKNGGADAVAVGTHNGGSTIALGTVVIRTVIDSPGLGSALTFTVYAGSLSGSTIGINGTNAGRKFGGSLISSITVREITE